MAANVEDSASFLRAVGTPLPKQPRSSLTPTRPYSRINSPQTSWSAGQRPSAPQRVWRAWLWRVAGAAGYLLAVCVFLTCRNQNSLHFPELPSGEQWLAQQAAIGQGSRPPQLPEGQTCGLDDRSAEVRRVHTACQQQVMAAQAAMERCKRQTAAAEATARDAEERQWIGVRNAKESARAAAKAVQEARAAQERAEEAAAASDRRAEQAEARALEAEARRDKALATAEEASAAAAVAIQDGKHHQERWSAEAAQCRSDAGAAAQAARGRAEALEGTLAECRGRVAGLGEGCGRCWEMLDEAQEKGRSTRLHAGGAAAAVSCLAWLAAYIYGRLMRRRVTLLRLKGEKLRLAAYEAQGGVKSCLAARAGPGTASSPAQQFLRR